MPAKKQKNHKRKSNGGRGDDALSRMNPTSSYQRRLGPVSDAFPTRIRRQMVWCENFAINTGAVQGQCGTELLIKLNGIFQPYSGNTHKPYGFNTLAAIYQQWIVRRARVELNIISASDNAAYQLAVGIGVSPPAGFISLTGLALSDVMEKSDYDVKFLEATGWSVIKRFTVDIPRITGLTPNQFQADIAEYAGLNTADPAKIVYLRLASANLSNTDNRPVRIIVRIFYEVEWFDRIIIAASN